MKIRANPGDVRRARASAPDPNVLRRAGAWEAIETSRGGLAGYTRLTRLCTSVSRAPNVAS
jgi:hypothetical protein